MENKNYLERVQFDNPMKISADEECIYEGKHICMKGEMVVEGILRFKNCFIEAADSKIKVKGSLYMEDCEVNKPNSEFLNISADAKGTVVGCDFTCTLPFYDSVIIARGNRDFLVRKCNFHGSPLVMSMLLKRNGRSVLPFEVPLIDANKGKILECKFTNFTGCRVANVLYLTDSEFENCHRIEVGGSGETTRVARCKFTDCKEVNVYDGTIELCVFRNIETMFVNMTHMIGCWFFDLKCDFDHIICLEDSNMENCRFDSVELKNDAYLIEAVGESMLEHCSFEKCGTTREDLELMHCEETKGRFFKKTVAFDIVDHHTCTGLDTVYRIEV